MWQMFDGISDPELTPEAYETYMLVEPYTGAALSLHKRLQVFILAVIRASMFIKLLIDAK